jgi:RNA polymerase sigma-54 factor
MLGYSYRHSQKQQHSLTLNQACLLGLNVLVLPLREVDASIELLEEQRILDATPSTQDEQSDSPNNAAPSEDVPEGMLPERSADPDYEDDAKEFIPISSQADQGAASQGPSDRDWRPEDYLTAPAGFRELILAQLEQLHLSDQHQRIAVFIVEALDGRGFFTEDMEESARACNVAIEDFRSVLAALQQCEPPGVAARNAWDAIRLVLERNARKQTLECRIASSMGALVETGEFRELTAGASPEMSKTDCERAAVQLSRTLATRLAIDELEARQIIKRLLMAVPHPVDQLEEESTPWRNHHLQSVEESTPDVAISRCPEGGFAVELCGGRYGSIDVSKTLLVEIDNLKEELKSLREAKHLTGEKAAETKTKIFRLTIEREQKEECKEHALQFLRACADRRATLLRVATVLAHRQKAFLKSGKVFDLQCFSPDDAGAELELEEFGGQALSESTVSRTVQDKFVRLPNGDVKPLKLLCSPGEKATNTDGQEIRYLPEIVKRWIRDYIRREDRAHPLSDEQITKAIERDEDLVLARKTIENYRKELELPSARERKRKPTKH